MNKKLIATLLTGLTLLAPSALVSASESSDGMIHLKSDFSLKETAQRLETMLLVKNIKILQIIDHAKNAQSVDETLKPTTLVLFGNPKIGTPLMNCQRTVALDLPQKALIWENDAGEVTVSYNSPDYLKSRHQLSGCEKPLAKLSKALTEIMTGAAKR